MSVNFIIDVFNHSKDEDNGSDSKVAMSDDLNDYLTFYLHGIAGLVVCCVGIICNTLAVIVLCMPQMRTSNTNIYLIALGVSDTLNLFSSLFVAIKDIKPPAVSLGHWDYWSDYPSMPHLFLVFHPLAILFQVSSVWLTVAFTTDRYIMICHPFWAERRCSSALAIGVVAALLVCSLIYNIPRFLEYEVFHDPDMGNTWYHLSPFGRSEVFQNYYHFVSWVIFIVLLPLSVISFMNLFLIREIHVSTRRHATSSERRKRDTNIMLVSVVVLFLICQIPPAVSHVLWALSNAFNNSFIFIFNEIANLMILLNSAINIVPYYFFGKKFRREFQQLFCPCTAKDDAEVYRRTSYTLANQQVHQTHSNKYLRQPLPLYVSKRNSQLSTRNNSEMPSPVQAHRITPDGSNQFTNQSTPILNNSNNSIQDLAQPFLK